MDEAPRENRPVGGGPPPVRWGVGTVLKWVAGITAVITLVFSLMQLWDRVFGYQTRRRHVDELLATGRVQLEQHDFAHALASDSQAAQLAGDNDAARRAQEDVAMAWLEEASIKDGETFQALTAPLMPILQRGLVHAEAQRRADLLAHLGWAEFLRSRDGVMGLAPDSLYRQAVAIDPGNVYAHAMLGHWTMWRNGGVDEALAHFAIAFSSGRSHAYARGMELAALRNSHDAPADNALIRVANEMRVNHEPIDEESRRRIGDVYYSHVMAGDDPSLLLAALPAAEQLATFEWLFSPTGDEDVIHRYVLALLEEATGARSEARRTLESLRREHLTNWRVQAGVEAAMRRLAR